jgi:cell division protein FtsL
MKALIIALVFVIAIAGTILYYTDKIANLNNQITNLTNEDSNLKNQLANTASLNDQITNLTSQNSNLTAQVTNLGSQVTNLNTANSKIPSLNDQIANLNSQISNLKAQITNPGAQIANLTSPYLVTALGITEIAGNLPAYLQFNRLWISGTVTNKGEGTAFNSGLHVVAYTANGTQEVDITVPLNNNNVVTYGTDAATNDLAYGSNGDNYPSFQLISLGGGGTAYIGINIYHEGTVTNWTVTPVWTNIP